MTDIVWRSGSDVPQIAYYPVRQRPSYVGVAHTHGHHASSPAMISSARYRQLLSRLHVQRLERGRLAVLKQHVRHNTFSARQARQLVRKFRSTRYQKAAAATLRGHIGKARSTLKRRLVKTRRIKSRTYRKTTARLARVRR